MQLGKGALLRGWPSTAPLGFQPGSQGTGVLVHVRGSQAMVAPSTSLDCAWFPSPCAALLHMSSEECTQLKCLRDLYLLAGKRLGQLSLPVAKEAVKKTGGSPWSAPRDLSLLGPYFLGIAGCAVEDPLHAAQLPSWLCLAGDNSPKGPACGCFGFSPGLSVTVMLQGRLEILVLLWHEKQGPRGQSEGKLVFHMSAPLRVVAVFIPQAEMQEQDRE